MPHYIFIHDTRDNSFPERYRVVNLDEETEEQPDTEDLTGTVRHTEAIEFLEELQARYESDEMLIAELIDAPSWDFIEARYRPAEVDEEQQDQ